MLCALSLLLDHFKKDDQLFAAQCIWWLASIIQFTEILVYYRHYKIFPSNFIVNWVVTLLRSIVPERSLIPEPDIPVLKLYNNSDSEVHSSWWKLPHKSRNKKQAKLNTTHCGNVFQDTKYQEPSIHQLWARFGNQSKKQQRRTCELPISGELDLEGDYALT